MSLELCLQPPQVHDSLGPSAGADPWVSGPALHPALHPRPWTPCVSFNVPTLGSLTGTGHFQLEASCKTSLAFGG